MATPVEERFARLDERFDRIEERFARGDERLTKLEVKSAVDQERHDNIIKRLDRIDGHVNKLVWLIITAIIGAFMTFLIRGGFHVG